MCNRPHFQIRNTLLYALLCIKVDGSRTVVYFLLALLHATCSLKQVGKNKQALLGPCCCKRLLLRAPRTGAVISAFSSPSSLRTLHGEAQPILQKVFPRESDITDIFKINHLNTESKTQLKMFLMKLFSGKNMKRQTLLSLTCV